MERWPLDNFKTDGIDGARTFKITPFNTGTVLLREPKPSFLECKTVQNYTVTRQRIGMQEEGEAPIFL